MTKIEKPWGEEIVWALTNDYVGKIINILPGQRLSLQYHEKKEETVYVLEGKLCIWVSEDENKIILNEGASYHVNPGQIHRFGSLPNSSGCKIVEVSTNHLDDVVRIKDDYNRTEK